MIDGTFTGDELWYRCTHCGDSDKHPDKAHCSVNIFTSTYYCLRCSSSGRMSSLELGFITRGLNFDAIHKITNVDAQTPDEMVNGITAKIQKGQASSRYSAMERFKMMSDFYGPIDVFKCQHLNGKLLGYHFRYTHMKVSKTWGKRGVGLPSSLKYDRPWRLVEGPFDSIDPACDICTFGFISQNQLRLLYGQELIVCPDGDVWKDRRKLRQYMKPIFANPNLLISHVERIPDGKDPDEVAPSGREILTMKEVKDFITPKHTFFTPKLSPQLVLDSIQDQMSEKDFWSQVS